jgi:hypothetical protein
MRPIALVLISGAGFLLTVLCSHPASAQSTGYKLTASPAAVVRWDEIKAIDRMSAAPSTGRVVPSPGRGPGPQPLNSGQVPPVSPAAPPPHLKEAVPRGKEPTAGASGPAALSFRALLDNNTVIPPDTYGAVGPSHVMTMLNTQVRIQNKVGDTISTVSLSTFWSSLPSSSATFDPRVQYDALHGRWIASCGVNAASSNSKLNFAISATSDPTGTWAFYQVLADTLESGVTSWADYPCLGFNSTWFVVTANMFRVTGGTSFQGVRMWAIDASSVLSGGTMSYTLFPTKFDVGGGVNGFTLQPCVTYGSGDTLYIVDNSGVFATIDTTFLVRLSRITGTASAPVWSVNPGSSFASTGLFRVANNFNITQINATQSGTSTLVETNDFRLLSAAYRSGRIWCTHSGGLPAKIAQAPNRTAVFWYQLNPMTMPNPIVQSGVLDGGAGKDYYFPSIAANANGDASLGFTRSDASRFAEAVFTGRLASDPAGTMQTIQQLKAGESSYSKFFSGTENRWGDYSNTCVDPADDLTFWTIQEYASQNVGSAMNDGRWGTWWGKVAQVSLPIQIASLTAVGSASGTVRLEWMTSSEVNNYGFEVQKIATQIGGYESIPGSFVHGHGTTTAPQNYSYTDKSPGSGMVYYRLKQLDLDGAIRYSDGVAIDVASGVAGGEFPTEFSLAQSYPNPFNPSTNIRYGLPQKAVVTLEVFTALGQRVATLVHEQEEAGYHEVAFNASGLASGAYFYTITAGYYHASKKLVLMK